MRHVIGIGPLRRIGPIAVFAASAGLFAFAQPAPKRNYPPGMDAQYRAVERLQAHQMYLLKAMSDLDQRLSGPDATRSALQAAGGSAEEVEAAAGAGMLPLRTRDALFDFYNGNVAAIQESMIRVGTERRIPPDAELDALDRRMATLKAYEPEFRAYLQKEVPVAAKKAVLEARIGRRHAAAQEVKDRYNGLDGDPDVIAKKRKSELQSVAGDLPKLRAELEKADDESRAIFEAYARKVFLKPIPSGEAEPEKPEKPEIRLLAKRKSGLTPSPCLVVGIPMVAEAVFTKAPEKPTCRIALEAGGAKLELTARATPEDAKTFRTEPFLAWPAEDILGPPPPRAGPAAGETR